MLELNFTSTNAQDPTGAEGQVTTPYLGTVTPGYNYGGVDGFMSFGPFTVDQAGNVTTTGTVTSAGGSSGSQINAADPTGVPATDTANLQIAVTALSAALAFGPCALVLGNGMYMVNSNEFVIQSLSNFALVSAGATSIMQAPNTVALPNNTSGDLCVIADCTDFTVGPGMVFDGNRDVVAPLTPLTASASASQPAVTVANGAGAAYQAGQRLFLFGGVGAADQNVSEGFSVGSGSPLVVQSIGTGLGAGGGDLITFTTNLVHAWSVTGGTALSDGYGPYAWTSDYLTPYQTGSNTVAGRSLGGEDQQCGIHLMNCQRFSISGVQARNTWESPIKLGTGERSGILSIGDACSQGSVIDCNVYHAYDQGISVWLSDHISVTGCQANAAGWAGLSLTASDYCTVTGSRFLNSVYRAPNDPIAGHGLTIEGGVRNTITGNLIDGPYCSGLRLIVSPLHLGLPGTTSNPTITGFLAAGQAAGTSIPVSTTANLAATGKFAIIDGERSEAITIATVVDGTHITLSEVTRFSHASGIYIGNRIAEENTVTGNIIRNCSSAQSDGNGIDMLQAARNLIKGNVIGKVGGTGIYFGSAYGGGYISGSPTNTALGGDGSTIEGNIVGPILSTGGPCIYVIGTAGVKIIGNTLSGTMQTGGFALGGINLAGAVDIAITNNTITEILHGPGINTATGGPASVACSRVLIKGNRISRISQQGIALNLADSCKVIDNAVSSCGSGNGGIALYGVTNSLVASNSSNSNGAQGISLNNSSSTGCTNNRVIGNTTRNDGTGYNMGTGGTYTQQTGIIEAGNSDFNVFAFNASDGNSSAQLTLAGTHSRATGNIISGAVIPAAVTTPGVPLTTVAQQNTTGHDVMVYITALALTAVSVGATAIGAQPMVYLPAGQTITLTYTGSPTWVWAAAG